MNKHDLYTKLAFILIALYLFGHIANAMAQNPPPYNPIVQCFTNGLGTIQCIQI
jgi:hypothetical protein